MRIRYEQSLALCIALVCLPFWAAARHGGDDDVAKCAVCGKVIEGTRYLFDDESVGGEKKVCKECRDLKTRCFLCGLPVREDYATLKDGRLLCARDNREAIHSSDEARTICEDVRVELNRTFSRFMSFPAEDVTVTFLDRFHLEDLFKTTGYEHCVSIFGATESHVLGDERKFAHSIGVLSDLKKPRLQAVFAHESTHTWISENVKKRRMAVLSSESMEGFCELVAYKLMESHRESFEMEAIKKNDYTKGQITALLEAEKVYGFNAVLDWVQNGEDEKVDIAHLDRIRAIEAGSPTPAAATSALVYVPATAPIPAPDKLILKGISGTARHRFALINNATLELMEKGKVRIGLTNVSVQCLEIRDNSVVIQVDGSKEKQELFIQSK